MAAVSGAGGGAPEVSAKMREKEAKKAARLAKYAEEVAQRAAEVEGLIASKKPMKAVAASLNRPPLSVPSQEIKDDNFRVVMRAMAAVREAKIKDCVEGLDDAYCDTLMKYVYRAMEEGISLSSMLKWHAHCLSKGGLATIVRTMTETKGV